MAAKQKNNMRKIWYALFFIALFTLGTIIYVLPSVSDAFTDTYLVEYGGIQVSCETECYIIRDEKVFIANRSGELQYYAEEGKKLRKGAKVLDIVSGNPNYDQKKYAKIMERMGGSGESLNSYTAQQNGVVSYHLDGYENYFSPDRLDKLTYEKISKMDFDVQNVTRDATFAREPLYKIADNKLWYAVCWVDEQDIAKFQVGHQVSIALPLGEVQAKIDSISDESGRWKVVLESNRYYESLCQLRKVSATITTEDDKGLVIPNESIASVKGQMGVYVKAVGGDYIFKPVKVITSDGEYSLIVQGSFYRNDGKEKVETVDVYDEILRSGKL